MGDGDRLEEVQDLLVGSRTEESARGSDQASEGMQVVCRQLGADEKAARLVLREETRRVDGQDASEQRLPWDQELRRLSLAGIGRGFKDSQQFVQGICADYFCFNVTRTFVKKSGCTFYRSSNPHQIFLQIVGQMSC